jgi:hypothetical protein
MGRERDAAAVLAPITRDLEVIENGSYHRLLLLYKGELPVDSLLSDAARGRLAAGAGGEATVEDVTIGYGVGNWHWYNGRRDEALRLWRQIAATPQWAAFGALAAEAVVAKVR